MDIRCVRIMPHWPPTSPADPWDMSDPRRDHTTIPYTDAHTESLVDDLVDTLIILRCPMGLALLKTAALDAGVPLRDVQEAASHADPRATMRYDLARVSLDRHATYVVAAFLAGAAR